MLLPASQGRHRLCSARAYLPRQLRRQITTRAELLGFDQ